MGYSRMCYIEFTQRQGIHHLLASMVHGFRYFGGLTEILLTGRMKTVLLDQKGGELQFQPGARCGVGGETAPARTGTATGGLARPIGVDARPGSRPRVPGAASVAAIPGRVRGGGRCRCNLDASSC